MILIYIVFFIFLSFAIVIFFGAPFVPTLPKTSELALQMLDLKKGDKFVDLGCGDGRLIALLKNSEIDVVGVEVNPVLFVFCKIRFLTSKNIKIYFGDYRKIVNISKYDAIYIFGIKSSVGWLEQQIKLKSPKKLKVISNGFEFKKLKPVDKQGSLVLYEI